MSGKSPTSMRAGDRELPPKPLPCAEILPLLLEYMSRELGPSRSDLVREHLRKCESCRSAAAEIQHTFDALKSVARLPAGADERLSPERRAKVLHAVAHPVSNWIVQHHALVSIIAALVAFTLALLFVTHLRMHEDNPSGEFTPVIIGKPPPGAFPGDGRR